MLSRPGIRTSMSTTSGRSADVIDTAEVRIEPEPRAEAGTVALDLDADVGGSEFQPDRCAHTPVRRVS
jgi:hypothetical protein